MSDSGRQAYETPTVAERHAALVAALRQIEAHMRQTVRTTERITTSGGAEFDRGYNLGLKDGAAGWADRLAAELRKVEQS